MPGENSERILVFIRAARRRREDEAWLRGGGKGLLEREGEKENDGIRGAEVSVVPLRPQGLGARARARASVLFPSCTLFPFRALRSASYYYYFLSQYLLFPHSVLC